MLITIKDLNDLKACDDQVELFQQVFGEAAEINKENILKALQNKLDVDWWCRQIFGNEAYLAATKPLLEAYLAATKPLLEAYEAARKPLWEAYLAARKPLLEAYEAAKKPLLEAYLAARKPLWEDYLAAIKPLREDYQVSIADWIVSKIGERK